MTRVCLYTRISTDEENQPTSLHSQHERLEAFCKVQDGWRIVAHKEDRSTGTKLERPGLTQALELSRERKIDLLLVYRVDRLSRKGRQLAQLAEELDGLGVVPRSATEPFDTGSAAGRMMLQMLGVFAEFEHATIVDRVSAGIERRAKEGKWATGRLPFRLPPQRSKRRDPGRAHGANRAAHLRPVHVGQARHRRDRPPTRRRADSRATLRLAARHRPARLAERGLSRRRALARPEPARHA
jgi:DNA invertase Pin-like site-specific DNA recombinase